MENRDYFTVGTNDDFEPDILEEIAEEKSRERKKSKYARNKILFRVMAIVILLASVACGIIFSFTETSRFVPGVLSVVNETVFEVWRLVLFLIVGISGAASLWATSEVFAVLDKKSKRK